MKLTFSNILDQTGHKRPQEYLATWQQSPLILRLTELSTSRLSRLTLHPLSGAPTVLLENLSQSAQKKINEASASDA
jgi:hypothetical protein